MLNFFIARPHRSVWLAVSVLSASASAWAQPVGAIQQDRQPTLQASQANTPVPPVQYQSAFENMPKGVESTTVDWKAANATVGQFKRGHADVLKWEQEQAGQARKTQSTEPKAPAPAASATSNAGAQP